MRTNTEAAQLLLLLTWMSPAFPTGAFVYSHGLEWAVESDAVTNSAELKGWIADLLTRGSGWNDAATLTSVAVRLVPIGQTAGLEVLRDLAPAIARTAERASIATLDDLGAITLGADIAAMKHETQHSRVFRT